MKRILALISIFVGLTLPVSAQKTKPATNADKARIIQSILLDRRFDERYALPDEVRLVVFLSTENIDRDLVSGKIGEAKILLKSPEEIEKEKKDWREYCAFGKFEIDGSTMNVSFYYYTKDSKNEGFDRVVLEYEYRKVAGKWKFISRKHPGLILGS